MTTDITLIQLDNVPQLFEFVSGKKIERVIDIGCHRGAHIVDILRPQFPDAEILGVEPKEDNYNECLKSNIDKVKFLKLDCRRLRKEEVGVFDFVWCFGLIYHLDDPTSLMKALNSITHDGSFVCIDGHIAIDGEQAALPEPNPSITSQVLDGQIYYGKLYKEFEEKTPHSEKEKLHKASLDNPWSFWLTYGSIVKLFVQHGFDNIIEFRCNATQTPYGPGLVFSTLDPTREWSRRLFLLSRKRVQ